MLYKTRNLPGVDDFLWTHSAAMADEASDRLDWAADQDLLWFSQAFDVLAGKLEKKTMDKKMSAAKKWSAWRF